MAKKEGIFRGNRGAMTILMLSMLSILVLTGMSLFEVQLASSRDTHYSHSMAQARFLAQSGLQQARYYSVKVDPAWQGTSPEQEMDGGTFEYTTARDVVNRLYTVNATGYVPNKTDKNKVQYSFSTTFKFSPIPVGIVVLHPTLAKAMEVAGNSQLTISASDGRAAVNSNASNAVSVNGSSKVSVNEMDVVGGISGEDQIQCTDPLVACIAKGAAPMPDPLAWLPEPVEADFLAEYGANKGSVAISGSTDLTINPGVYNAISAKQTSTLRMSTGKYFVKGGFVTANTAKVYAPGVFIYTTGTAAIDLASTGYYELEPITDPANIYAGILFFQRRGTTVGMKLTSNGGAILEGAFYTRDAALELTGNGSSEARATGYVIRTLKVTGNGTVTITELPDP